MKEIEKIDTIRPNYGNKLLGDQVRIVDTPFHIQVGVLNDDGKVYNKERVERTYIDTAPYTIALNVDNETVISWRNNKYREMTIAIQCTSNPTSYDYRLVYLSPSTPSVLSSMRDSLGNQIWVANGKTGTGISHFHGECPMGGGMWSVTMDNNDGAGPVVGNISVELSNQVLR